SCVNLDRFVATRRPEKTEAGQVPAVCVLRAGAATKFSGGREPGWKCGCLTLRGQLRRPADTHRVFAVNDMVDTPWGDHNRRLRAPDGMQLTLFEDPQAETG
ncbi:MAG: hypothetical protein ACR2H7_08885, partial [Actinomycetota bacterium]